MNIKHYISVAMLALMGAAFAGCDGKEEPGYDSAAKPADAQRVFFASPTINKIVTDDVSSFNVPVYRPEDASSEALTVQILTTDESGIFSVATSVEFQPGSNIAEIPVKYHVSAMTPNTVYPVVLAIDEANADVYGIASVTVNINFEQMTDWALFGYDPENGRNGYGVWTLGTPFSGFFANMRVFERHIPTNPKEIQYAVQLNIPGNLEGTIEESDIDTSNTDFNDADWITAIEMSSSDGGKTITVPRQQCVFNSTVIFAEASVLYPSSFPKSTSYFDEVSGTFFLNLMYADDEGAWNPAVNPIVLYGYADTNDYYINLTDAGQVSIADNDYAVIGVTFPKCIEWVDYTVVREALTEEEVAAVAAKIQEEGQTDYTVNKIEKAGNITLDFPTSGTYTMVAVGYHTSNKGEVEAKAIASVVFDYKTFNPYLGWTVVKENVAYTDHILAALFGAPEFEVPYNVTIDKSDDYEGLYRISNPYKNFPYVDAIGTLGKFGSIELDCVNPAKAFIPVSDCGVNVPAMGGQYGLCSYSYYMLAGGAAEDEVPAAMWGALNGSVFSLSAMSGENDNNMIICVDGAPKYVANVDFGIDLNGAPAAAKPARRNAALSRIAAKAFNGKAPVFPARFHGNFQSVKRSGKPAIMSGARRR